MQVSLCKLNTVFVYSVYSLKYKYQNVSDLMHIKNLRNKCIHLHLPQNPGRKYQHSMRNTASNNRALLRHLYMKTGNSSFIALLPQSPVAPVYYVFAYTERLADP